MIFTTDPAYASLALEPDPGQQAEDAQLYRHVLHGLLHIGTDLARLLHQQAVAHAQAAMQDPAPPGPSTDQATAFDRIARAIRRTITLARSLNEPLAPAPDRTARPGAAARTPTLHETGQGAAGHPSATPAATPGRDDSADASSADLHGHPEVPDRDAPDRDEDDRDEDDTGCPPAAVIAEIRRDLGLDTSPGAGAWTRRNPAGTAQPGTQAAAPGGAAAGAPRQSGPGPQYPGPRPQEPSHDAAQHAPGPQPEQHDPSEPVAIPRTQPAPIRPGSAPPDDPAAAIATIPHHGIRAEARWQPPSPG